MSQSPLLHPCPCSGASPTLMPSALPRAVGIRVPAASWARAFGACHGSLSWQGPRGEGRVCACTGSGSPVTCHSGRWGRSPPTPPQGKPRRQSVVVLRTGRPRRVASRLAVQQCGALLPLPSACGKPVTCSLGCLVFRGVHVPS